MPTKGCGLNCGKRNNIITPKFHRHFMKKTGINISYKEFKEIIFSANDEIFNIILEDISGFKLPYGMGYFCVTKYKPSKIYPDKFYSKLYKKVIPHTNQHSFEWIYHLKWFKVNNSRKSRLWSYKFVACRRLKRALPLKIYDGKLYQEWKKEDFWSKSRMEKTFYKFYKLTE